MTVQLDPVAASSKTIGLDEKFRDPKEVARLLAWSKIDDSVIQISNAVGR